ncbi:hypothetical protein ANCCAN_27643, partial [Ancylostoma caninum]
DVTPRIGHSYGTVLVSTLDGQLRALNTEDGSTKWTLQDGSKRDVWLEIDPLTGSKVETLSATNDKVCPANNKNAVFVGRTEYRVCDLLIRDFGDLLWEQPT